MPPFLLALALAQANPYAKWAPAKLIVMPPGQPALAVDYATMERCQRARGELLRQDSERDAENAAQDRELANRYLGPVVRQHVTAYCIPK